MKATRFLVPALTALVLLASFVPDPCRGGTSVPAYRPTANAAARPWRESKGLNAYQRERVRRYLRQQTAGADTLRVLAIQVQFADSLMGGQPGSARSAIHDSTYFANGLRHVEQYYRAASRGDLLVEWRVTPKLYNLPERMRYYGNDDLEETRGVELMQSVIDSADADEDFSLYDTFMVIHAGAGQETDVFDNSRAQLFSTFFDRTDIDLAFEDSTVFGLQTGDSIGGEPFLVDNFMLVPEDASQDDITIGSLGIWVFEVGSRLGLVPLFDSTPGGFPDSRGIGEFDLMSYGLFNAQGFVPAFPSAFNRLIAGWLDPLEIDADGSFRLHDVNRPAPGDTSCLKISITGSEYFLVVNRVHDTNFDSLFTFNDLDSNLIPGNDDSLEGAEFDFFLTDFTNPYVVKPDPNMGGRPRRFVNTGSGIYVWHVDETVVRQNLEAGFLPNDFASRKGVDLEEADGIQDMDKTSGPFAFGSHFDSFRAANNATFGPTTQPGSESNAGAPSGTTIGDVSAPDSFMTFTVDISLPYGVTGESGRRWSAPSRPPLSISTAREERSWWCSPTRDGYTRSGVTARSFWIATATQPLSSRVSPRPERCGSGRRPSVTSTVAVIRRSLPRPAAAGSTRGRETARRSSMVTAARSRTASCSRGPHSRRLRCWWT